ncbi:MAG TPA: hypothetical protein VGS19_04205 [Streptosporangiaceae bacterium]|nr:hypothetical protein [Streptosporangiaceae bacterium]
MHWRGQVQSTDWTRRGQRSPVPDLDKADGSVVRTIGSGSDYRVSLWDSLVNATSG